MECVQYLDYLYKLINCTLSWEQWLQTYMQEN